MCLSKLVGPELDFGEQPLCDDLQTTSQESLSVKKYHQNIVLCEKCLTAHQKFQVPKLRAFKPILQGIINKRCIKWYERFSFFL